LNARRGGLASLLVLTALTLACPGELEQPQPGAGDAGPRDLPGKVADSALPCPCKAPLVCVNKVCRKKCTVAKCNGAGGCPAGMTCLKSTAGVPVCVPGAALGKSCNASTHCAGGLLCLSYSSSDPNGRCFKVCDVNAGGPCPSGSKCTTSSGMGCGYCYP